MSCKRCLSSVREFFFFFFFCNHWIRLWLLFISSDFLICSCGFKIANLPLLYNLRKEVSAVLGCEVVVCLKL